MPPAAHTDHKLRISARLALEGTSQPPQPHSCYALGSPSSGYSGPILGLGQLQERELWAVPGPHCPPSEEFLPDIQYIQASPAPLDEQEYLITTSFLWRTRMILSASYQLLGRYQLFSKESCTDTHRLVTGLAEWLHPASPWPRWLFFWPRVEATQGRRSPTPLVTCPSTTPPFCVQSKHPKLQLVASRHCNTGYHHQEKFNSTASIASRTHRSFWLFFD